MLYKILITLMFFNAIACMDTEEKEIEGNPSLALSITLRHGITLFDHPTICSSAINKECEKALQDTACLRKKHLSKVTLRNTYTWHKYGSATGKMEHDVDHFYLEYFLLANNNTAGYGHNLAIWRHKFNNQIPGLKFNKKISGFENVQFDSMGQLIFYGISKKKRLLFCGVKTIMLSNIRQLQATTKRYNDAA